MSNPATKIPPRTRPPRSSPANTPVIPPANPPTTPPKIAPKGPAIAPNDAPVAAPLPAPASPPTTPPIYTAAENSDDNSLGESFLSRQNSLADEAYCVPALTTSLPKSLTQVHRTLGKFINACILAIAATLSVFAEFFAACHSLSPVSLR